MSPRLTAPTTSTAPTGTPCLAAAEPAGPKPVAGVVVVERDGGAAGDLALVAAQLLLGAAAAAGQPDEGVVELELWAAAAHGEAALNE